MKRLKLFREFFDTEDLRNKSKIDVDYSGNFLTRLLKKRKNKKTLKDAAAEVLKGFSEKDSHIQNKIFYILRECPLLKSEYFRITNDNQNNIFFDYQYEYEDSSWRLLIALNVNKCSVMTGYQANIYGYEMITEKNIIHCEDIEEMVEKINNELVPKISQWGKKTFEITKVNPIPYEEQDLKFSSGNN